MSLIVNTLGIGLANVFRSRPSSGVEAAMKIVGEYDKYCKTAMATPAIPIFTGAGKVAFQGVLMGALSSSNGSAAMTASAISQGMQLYWLSPPVIFTAGPVNGIVSAMPGAAAVLSGLTTVLSNTMNSEDICGQQLAALMDTATRTVLVVFSTPVPPAGPPPPAMVL